MRNQQSRFVTHTFFCLLLACMMTMIFANHYAAQRPGPPPGSPDLKGEMRKTEVRETMLRNPDTGAPAAKVDPKRLEAALAKVQEDYKQIQIVRNELVRELLANRPLDWKWVAAKTNDINKRADRLRSYLLPPAKETKEQEQKPAVEFNREEMQAALVQLCNRIVSFVDNPMLKNPGITDVQQSAKAGADLLMIIELSSNVKRNAERLHKTAK